MSKGIYIVSVWPSQGQSQYYQNADTISQATLIDATQNSVENINFSISQGLSIHGNTYDNNGLALSGINIFVSAKNSDHWGFAQTKSDGSYVISGLEARDDYIVEARRKYYPPVYYHSNGIVMDSALASLVSTAGNQVNMTYYAEASISGNVLNTQRQPLSGIRISTESKKYHLQHACYSQLDGSFSLEGLPLSDDYEVMAIPSGKSIYQEQSLSNISTGNNSLYFMLTAGYTLSGVISSENTGDPVSGVYITVSSITRDIFKRTKSNSLGEYEITGLASSNDYAIIAT
ncbi:hypothetical protein MHK_001160, partial [Candidatus Magnetomorum sp. HK-1]